MGALPARVKNAPIRDIALADCEFGGVEKPNVLEYVEGLSLRNVKINGEVVGTFD